MEACGRGSLPMLHTLQEAKGGMRGARDKSYRCAIVEEGIEDKQDSDIFMCWETSANLSAALPIVTFHGKK